MAAAMMLASAVISIVFLFDFTRTLAELHRERRALIRERRDAKGFSV
ncbi:hypothetical protein SAMN05880582_101683 [Rhizobium sp. RU20A]|nr:hypothetical protein [Rhizobium sp. RU20A]SIQ08941.1 hypothetical protein SAMN05880582_101683 [Rhizobium sp. RU20A]